MRLVNFSCDTRYTCAVARIRALENFLLPNKVFLDLLESFTMDDFLAILEKAKYPKVEKQNIREIDVDRLLSLYLDEVMSFTRSLVLDKELIDIFYYRNDLENLHTLCVTEEVRDEFFLKGKFTRAELIDIMRNKRLSSFPTYLREVVGKILTQPDYDYLFDLLGIYKKLSLEYKSEFLHYLFAEEEKIVKDKIAIVKKIASDDKIDVEMLLQEEYKKNFNHVVSFYKKYNSLAILDKIGDDILTSIYKMTKFTFFGVEPLIAYYWAKRIEIINLRLIYLSKILNTPADFTSQLLRNSFLS